MQKTTNMKFIVRTLVLVMAVSQLGYAQKKDTKELEVIFKKVQNVYSQNSDFQIDTKYNMYRTYIDKQPEISYDGKIARKGDVYYSDVLNTEIIQYPDRTLRVSHEQKLIELSKSNEALNVSPFKLDTFLKYFVDYSITKVNGEIRCEMVADKLTTLPYGKVIVFIDAKDYTISRQVLYYLQAVEYQKEDGSIELRSPKLELLFSGFKTKNLLNAEAFKEANYIAIANNQIIPVEKLRSYNVIDRR